MQTILTLSGILEKRTSIRLCLTPGNHLKFELLVNTEKGQNIINLSSVLSENKGLVLEGMNVFISSSTLLIDSVKSKYH